MIAFEQELTRKACFDRRSSSTSKELHWPASIVLNYPPLTNCCST